ncbi:uncharacterized protein BYT42DRAFT_553416 [Radiomyces spectabilis]|uniref:uncharacterized protein n=1 Tax=Radiomyces spectabilis TaxID=64574 RepID=UPI00221EAD92|nr:uncharacterized protein BYT42DRAFT_553416 [Radiomyces spectabilis]KAI8394107.1 hypothetical protein BYT42DRAFT_553416 [Radiomyces spectabilis]
MYTKSFITTVFAAALLVIAVQAQDNGNGNNGNGNDNGGNLSSLRSIVSSLTEKHGSHTNSGMVSSTYVSSPVSSSYVSAPSSSYVSSVINSVRPTATGNNGHPANPGNAVMVNSNTVMFQASALVALFIASFVVMLA